MKKFIYMAVAAIAVLSSCSSEDDNNDSPKDGGAFYATVEDGGPRTTLNDDHKVLWSAGDKISVNGKEYTLNAGASTTHATFKGETTTETTYNAYYPASIYNGTTATLPATQTYEEGAISNLPMYAYSTDHNLVFKNLCAVLAITVTSDEISSVSSIEVISDQQMNGAFTTTTDGVLSFTSTESLTDADKKVTLTLSEAKTISESETFYIAIPAGTHNLTFKVNGTYNSANVTKKMKTKAASGVTVARNKIYAFTFSRNALPDDVTGYTELNYIEANGPQYIKATGHYIANVTQVSMVAEPTNNPSADATEWLFGAHDDDGTTTHRSLWIAWAMTSKTLTACVGNGSTTSSSRIKYTSSVAGRHSLLLDLNSKSARTFYVDGTKIGTSGYTSNLASGIVYGLVGAYHSSWKSGYIRFYSVKVWENSWLAFDLIPVQRNSDSAYGMYDLESDTFLGNDGTGSFTGN